MSQKERKIAMSVRQGRRASRRDLMELLADSRPASLEAPLTGRPAAWSAAAMIMTESRPTAQVPGPRRGRKRALLATGLVAVASGAAAAVLVSGAASPAPGRPANAMSGAASHAPGRPANATRPAPSRSGTGTGPAQPMSARAILLTAASHVSGGPVAGKYWRVQVQSGTSMPAGTRVNPYDISMAVTFDQWNPVAAGQREVTIGQQLGTVPASPADQAAWRAAGSPTTWKVGKEHDTLPNPTQANWGWPETWRSPLEATVTPSVPDSESQVSDGTVGYLEGDLPGLTAARFAAIPATEPGVEATLRQIAHHVAKQCEAASASASALIPVPPGASKADMPAMQSSCSTENEILWSEAVNLLWAPVSPQVRAATYQMMAGLPGVRSLGPMTDPLGRTGYGLTGGPLDQFQPAGTTEVIIIDPATGSYLATEVIGPMPTRINCMLIKAPGGHPPVNPPTPDQCAGAGFYGRSDPSQVWYYNALVSARWTNASPVLPPPSHGAGPSIYTSPGLIYLTH